MSIERIEKSPLLGENRPEGKQDLDQKTKDLDTQIMGLFNKRSKSFNPNKHTLHVGIGVFSHKPYLYSLSKKNGLVYRIYRTVIKAIRGDLLGNKNNLIPTEVKDVFNNAKDSLVTYFQKNWKETYDTINTTASNQLIKLQNNLQGKTKAVYELFDSVMGYFHQLNGILRQEENTQKTENKKTKTEDVIKAFEKTRQMQNKQVDRVLAELDQNIDKIEVPHRSTNERSLDNQKRSEVAAQAKKIRSNYQKGNLDPLIQALQIQFPELQTKIASLMARKLRKPYLNELYHLLIDNGIAKEIDHQEVLGESKKVTVRLADEYSVQMNKTTFYSGGTVKKLKNRAPNFTREKPEYGNNKSYVEKITLRKFRGEKMNKKMIFFTENEHRTYSLSIKKENFYH